MPCLLSNKYLSERPNSIRAPKQLQNFHTCPKAKEIRLSRLKQARGAELEFLDGYALQFLGFFVMVNLVCPGCGSLCDDIKIEIQDNRICRIENVCARGAAFLYALDNPARRAKCLVAGQEVSLEEAVEVARRFLREAKMPLIFGLDNSTLATQSKAIQLARKLKGNIDDSSSFSYGGLIQSLLEGFLASCPLSQIKDKADLLVYWGSNPLHSHPRHLCKYSYYSYTEYDEAGWVPKVNMACIEVRDTELSGICKPVFRLSPGEDGDFVQKILRALENNEESQEAKAFCDLVKNSRACVIFCGLGLAHSLNGSFQLFNEMIRKFSQQTRVSVIPMIEEVNMLGFNKTLRKETGYINKVSFYDGIAHGREFSFLQQIYARLPDCILIVSSDPLSVLPAPLDKHLKETKVICLSSLATLTTEVADVVIPTAAPGLESSGSVIRMDGEEVNLVQVKESSFPSEEEVLEQLLE